MSYYKCACGYEFQEFGKAKTGVSYAGTYETEGVCPECGGDDVDEGAKCERCGAWFDGAHSSVLCDDCRRTVATLDMVTEYARSISDPDEINPLLLYVAERELGYAGINALLKSNLSCIRKNYEPLFKGFAQRFDNHIIDFLSDDYSDFDEWYMEDNNGRAGLVSENGGNATRIS